MARAPSVDLRRHVVSAIASGLSCRAAAERFSVSASSAIRRRSLDRREGEIAPRR
jgi:transposase